MSETAELIHGDVFTSLTYERSSSIAKLTQALVKAQVAMRPAKKSSENPYFKSNYADLAAVWEVAQQPIADNGLAVLQPISSTPDGRIIHVTTILSHVSGEWISSVFSLTPKAENQSVSPQAAGSAITYGRRYALQSMLGIVSEDDDGEGAEGRGKQTATHHAKPAPTYQRPPMQQVAPEPADPAPEWTPEQHRARQKQLTEQQQQPAETPRANPANAEKPISDAQAKRLFVIAKQHGWENDELREFVATCGYEHSKDILRRDYDGIIEVIIGRQRDRV